MGVPEDYDWGLAPEKVEDIRKGFTVSVEVSLGAGQVEAALRALTGEAR